MKDNPRKDLLNNHDFDEKGVIRTAGIENGYYDPVKGKNTPVDYEDFWSFVADCSEDVIRDLYKKSFKETEDD
ncbi:hypothetical protein GF325_15600 [Candidatus Bathyarchaeota archaeon]|nr:hypothetical protein [Candidatus Bathyarchaeota archaeon]